MGTIKDTTEAASEGGRLRNEDDYCTLFPDTIGNVNIAHCCEAHDKAYELQTGKWEADRELFKCVKEAYPSGGMFLVAALMFAGVFTFGWLWYVRGGKR